MRVTFMLIDYLSELLGCCFSTIARNKFNFA